jgi:hypothetical protein
MQLGDAEHEFAEALRGTGEGAAEVAGQAQVANHPLREAMELTSNLPASAAKRGSQPTPASGGREPPGQGEDSPEPGSTADAPRTDDNDLGTGFVPNSPEATAEMIAGPEAAAELATALGKLREAGSEKDAAADLRNRADQANAESQSKSGKAKSSAKDSEPSKSATASSSGGSRQSGKPGENDDLKKGAPEVAATPDPKSGKPSVDGDPSNAAIAARALGQETWFAKLPPDLRRAIRAKAQRRPPRSYEEKLQKYFESID